MKHYDFDPTVRIPGVYSYSHNDMDGKAASYLIHKLLDKIKLPNDVLNFRTMTYDDPFDLHNEDDIVFITDLSFTNDNYERLINVCKTAKFVFWFDHHKSSTNVVRDHMEELDGIKNLVYWVDENFCGAMLTYAFYKMVDKIGDLTSLMEYAWVCLDFRRIDETLPMYEANCFCSDAPQKDPGFNLFWHDTIGPNHPIRLIDDHDRWTKKNEENTTAFNLGANVEPTSVTIFNEKINKRVFNPFWGRIFDEGEGGRREVKEAIARGMTIRRYLHSRYTGELRRNYGEYLLPGIGIYMVMNNRGNSWCFGDMFERYQGSILWAFNEQNQKYVYSVYTPDAYVHNMASNVLAEMLDGGGHAGAAGWSSDYQMCRCNQGGLGAMIDHVENAKLRIWHSDDVTPEMIEWIHKIMEQNKETTMGEYIYPEMHFFHKDPNNPITQFESSEEYIECVLCTSKDFKKQMDSFNLSTDPNMRNPFPLIYDLYTDDDGQLRGVIDIADRIADCLADIVNGFLIN